MAKQIEIVTHKFESSHGRKPKGYAAWGFILMDESCNKEVETIFTPAMTLSDAKKWVRREVQAMYPDVVETGLAYLEVAP